MAQRDRTQREGNSSSASASVEKRSSLSVNPTPAHLLQRAYADPSSLTAKDVKTLQHTIGNRATIGILSKHSGLQAKLKLGPAEDRYEQEADRVATQVMGQMDRPQPVQRMDQEEEIAQARPFSYGNADLQRQAEHPKPLAATISRMQRTPTAQFTRERFVQRQQEEEELAQMKPIHGPEGGEVESSVAQQIGAARGGGRPLDEEVRAKMEQGFGVDFSGVRVHTGGQADTLNRSLNARAFTVGNDVFFGKGQYNPASKDGQQLIAHELTHTVQQGATSAQRNMIQRKIGFEVETGIPITEVRKTKKGTKHYFDVFPGTTKIGMANGNISPDHVPFKRTAPQPTNEHFDGELPIVEFVSDAIDENLSDEDFLEWAGEPLNRLKGLKEDAEAASPPGDNTVLPRYNFGLPSDGITYEDRNWNRISVQATLDVGLAKVSDLVGKHGSEGQTMSGIEIDQAQVVRRASSVAEAVLKAYEKTHWGQKKKRGRAEVKGLMTMIVHHLLIGNNVQAQKMIYAKNRLGGVMYKTKLSTLVRNMGTNPYWAQIIAKRTRRPKLINHLINLTGRAGDEPIYLGYTDPVEDRRGTDEDRSSAPIDITVRTWLGEVLSGIDDQLFDELKNEWSEEIKPPSGIAAIEVRKPQSFMSPTLQNVTLSLDNPAGVANYLLEIYKWNRTI